MYSRARTAVVAKALNMLERTTACLPRGFSASDIVAEEDAGRLREMIAIKRCEEFQVVMSEHYHDAPVFVHRMKLLAETRSTSACQKISK